jgi:hypothetical protein
MRTRESQVDEIENEPELLTGADYENAALKGTMREVDD